MKLLAIRLSAFGDVAMTVPVIDAVARRYPDVEITVLSRPFMEPLFCGMPANVHFRGIDTAHYEGIKGIWRLFKELKTERFDLIADLHDVLRSKALRLLLEWSGARTAHIDKGRTGRKELVRSNNKIPKQLPSSFQRYEAVFAQLGLAPDENNFQSIYGAGKGDSTLFEAVTGSVKDGKRWIGIAPFAAHAGKILPEQTVRNVIATLGQDTKNRIFLFGGGKEERAKLESWTEGNPQVVSLAGKLKLDAELALISHLDVMLSMDSANMHLASLTATPVVSIWGATHPYAGFMGWKQPVGNAVQIDELTCRPCSIYGNKPCLRKDYACLHQISAEAILKKIEQLLSH